MPLRHQGQCDRHDLTCTATGNQVDPSTQQIGLEEGEPVGRQRSQQPDPEGRAMAPQRRLEARRAQHVPLHRTQRPDQILGVIA